MKEIVKSIKVLKPLLIIVLILLNSCQIKSKVYEFPYYTYDENTNEYFKIKINKDSTYSYYDNKCFEVRFGSWEINRKNLILYEEVFKVMIFDTLKFKNNYNYIYFRDEKLKFYKSILLPNKKYPTDHTLYGNCLIYDLFCQ